MICSGDVLIADFVVAIYDRRAAGEDISAADDLDCEVELMPDEEDSTPELFYCPVCRLQVDYPLVCGDCAAIICRRCGTPLEKADELGVG